MRIVAGVLARHLHVDVHIDEQSWKYRDVVQSTAMPPVTTTRREESIIIAISTPRAYIYARLFDLFHFYAVSFMIEPGI